MGNVLFQFSIMLTPFNEEDALLKIYYLTQESTKNWRKLLQYGESLDLEIKRKVLWVWPTEENLLQIRQLFEHDSITNILSIGCGNGLFEWLLKECFNLHVYGLEVDRNWWHSNYAIKTFIPLNYIEDTKEDSVDGNFLKQCCGINNWNFALMFCYFNNRLAFLEYLKHYQGNYIIIVGPADNSKSNVYTDPQPLEPNFPKDSIQKWFLTKCVTIQNNNVLVLYEKTKLNNTC